jgi:hypothetical protein
VTTRHDEKKEMAVLAGRQRRVKDPGPRSQAGQIVLRRGSWASSPSRSAPEGCATGAVVASSRLFESAGAAAGDHTQMAWEVDDLEKAIAEPGELRGIPRAGTQDG